MEKKQRISAMIKPGNHFISCDGCIASKEGILNCMSFFFWV